MKPRTRVIHLSTNEDFLLISSVDVTDERRDVTEERDASSRERLISPLSLAFTDGPASSSTPHSSSSMGLLSQGMLLSLLLGGRISTCVWLGGGTCCKCCCWRYCSHEDTTSVAVSGSEVTPLLSRPVSRLRDREGGRVRRWGRGRRGEPAAPSPRPPDPRTGSRVTGLDALTPRLRGEAERGLLVANNLQQIRQHGTLVCADKMMANAFHSKQCKYNSKSE